MQIMLMATAALVSDIEYRQVANGLDEVDLKRSEFS